MVTTIKMVIIFCRQSRNWLASRLYMNWLFGGRVHKVLMYCVYSNFQFTVFISKLIFTAFKMFFSITKNKIWVIVLSWKWKNEVRISLRVISFSGRNEEIRTYFSQNITSYIWVNFPIHTIFQVVVISVYLFKHWFYL